MILPSEATPRRWSADHQRLHRHLLRRPELLPAGSALLLAVSGGQDSMALTALLADLCPLHGWRLALWHGDHGWRPDSRQQAQALAAWAAAAGLQLHGERAEPPPSGEAAARKWRYACLESHARALKCTRVVTGHTASDRAETVLLNLARGSHRLGLSSLRAERLLNEREAGVADPLKLVRPLLPFSRTDTARLCQALALPVWHDASNSDPRFRRNRVRAEVLPLLEELHPGAARRIAAQAERLEWELEGEEELLGLALQQLCSAEGVSGRNLARRPLGQLSAANRRRLVAFWLRRQGIAPPAGRDLDALAARLAPERGPGEQDLAGGWRLRWDRSTLSLQRPGESAHGDG
ncbi:MAG: tRNA lysidine(34) synthetase TilS [Cyanobium sp.]